MAKSSVTRGRTVSDDEEAWQVACESDALLGEPLPVLIQGIALVIFRTQVGQLGALLDRCPHRDVPLSGGAVDGEHLRCANHGWEFSVEGKRADLPCVGPSPRFESHNATSVSIRERGGRVWVNLGRLLGDE